MEADINWRATRALTLFGGLSLLHGKYRNFPNSQVNLSATTGDATNPTACSVNPGTPTGGNRTIIYDVSGNSIIRTPFVQANGGSDYRVPVGRGEIGLIGKACYSSHYYGRGKPFLGARLRPPGRRDQQEAAQEQPDLRSMRRQSGERDILGHAGHLRNRHQPGAGASAQLRGPGGSGVLSDGWTALPPVAARSASAG